MRGSALVCSLLVGCSWLSPEPAPEPQNAAIAVPISSVPALQSGPWAELDGAIGDADLMITPEMFVASYPEATVADRYASFSDALLGHGWVQAADVSRDGMLTQILERDGRSVVFSVAEEDGVVRVVLQDLTVGATTDG